MRPEANMAEVCYRGQTYFRAGRRPYTRRDGTETTLSVWRSLCPACLAEFECETADEATSFRPLRHCPAHRDRSKWSHRVHVTPNAMVVRPGQRPFAPVECYDEERRG
jgi:hypothetical protein